MNTPNKRQLIILAALAIPIIGLMVLSFAGYKQRQPEMPKVAPAPGNATVNTNPQRPGLRIVLPTFQELKDNIHSRWNEAEKMTPEQYSALLRRDPRLPPTLELYRERIRSRMHQLDTMTHEQFEAEQRMREDHLRQRGITPAPRQPGDTAKSPLLLESPHAAAPAAPAQTAPAPVPEATPAGR